AGNTLRYDADGLNPTVSAGASPGEVIITLAGFGSTRARNYQQINIVNVAPLVIVPGAPRMIEGVEGEPLVDTPVATFTLPLPTALLVSSGEPSGFAASDFTATIDWGDPSPDAIAGTITQDATNPSLYFVSGTHTFRRPGTYTVAPAMAFAGATITGMVSGD